MAARAMTPGRPLRWVRHLDGVPVLLYHGLHGGKERARTSRGHKYSVGDSQFASHLGLLRSKGFAAKLLEDLWGSPNTPQPEGRWATLTFDDGLESHYNLAFPLLRAAGLGADFFINTAHMGLPGYLSWGQIGEMKKAGMGFHSHSHEHVDLTRLSDRLLETQLCLSKWQLEDRLGAPVEFLAVPYGLVNPRVIEAALRLGYRAVCTSRIWPALPGASTINRVAVYGHTALSQLGALLGGTPLAYFARAAQGALRTLPKRLLLRWQPDLLGVRVLEKHT